MIREAERVELVRQALSSGGVDLIHGERDWLAQAPQHFRQVAIGAGDFGSPVDQKNDLRGASRAKRACFRIWLGISSASFCMIPPVSISSNRRPRYDASPWIRSRVIPGLVAHDGAARARLLR